MRDTKKGYLHGISFFAFYSFPIIETIVICENEGRIHMLMTNGQHDNAWWDVMTRQVPGGVENLRT